MPVTHLGVDQAFSADVPPPVQAPPRYVLFVGRRDGYKDFATLADAFAGLPDDGTVLVAVGGGRFTDAELARLARLGIAGRTRHVEADDSALPAWYAGALAFVFPSRYEGFGLPTLEAMASGTATVLADSSSHPEVGGDVARYFPPGDSDSLCQVLAEILGDERLRASLARKGVSRAAEFTWVAAARATAAVYAAALGADRVPA
jgi:glycosyltransferase involved in cell wall biosynthesis